MAEEQKKDEALVAEPEEQKDSCLLKNVNNKTYLNLYCCQINIGLVFTYIYIFVSASLNVINRILFQNYNFHFNFTLSIAQQFTSLLLYTFASKSKTFIKHAGNINFQDFWKNKWLFLSFSFFFMANILFNFYGNQMVPNVNMFLSLRKLNAIALFLMDIYIGKKRFSCVTVSSIILIVGGAFVIGYDKLDSNLLGYLVVLGNNLMSLLYTKYSEVFRNITGFSNLKLLVYNAYICNPILLAGIFITGEYKRLILYFTGEKIFEGSYFGAVIYLFFFCAFCVCLILSFFISNEKNSSLFTAMLSNSKDVIITGLSYFWLKGTKFTFCIIGGLLISTVGAVLIAVKSMYDNTRMKKEAADKVKIKESENEN